MPRQWWWIHGRRHSPVGSRMKRLFFRLKMFQIGLRGFTSSIEILTVDGSTNTGMKLFSGSPAWISSCRSAFRRARSVARSLAAWYVRHRSRRKVSVKKKKLHREIPPRIARRQKVALQPHAFVTAPPINGPNDGPRRGAA